MTDAGPGRGPVSLPAAPRATLIHNGAAAGHFRMPTARILAFLRAAGYRAEHVPTETEADLEAALKDPGDVVVAAGGDGTIRGVALTLARLNPRAALAPLPLGTANNIARTLGLKARTETLLRGLARPRTRPFDLGHVRGPWGEARFLEAFGLGLFAHGLARYNPKGRKSLVRAAGAAFRTLAGHEAREVQLELGGRDRSGRYLMVEAMNTASMGLRLQLAPGADPGDGVFDVILVREDRQVSPYAYLRRFVWGGLDRLPNVERVRTSSLRIVWDGLPLHLDEELRGDLQGGGSGGELSVGVQPGALTLWLPTPPRDHDKTL